LARATNGDGNTATASGENNSAFAEDGNGNTATASGDNSSASTFNGDDNTVTASTDGCVVVLDGVSGQTASC
jgi:hypothetical protein